MKHELKTWPTFWDAINERRKTFEVRKNDRNFQVGDILILQHYDPENESFSGEWIEAVVTYVLRGPAFGVQDGFCVMALDIQSSFVLP